MITVALLLVAAEPVKPIPALKPATKTEIQKRLDLELLDGASARYLWPTRADSSTYCGFVNAKNALGAYTGWKLFHAMLLDSPTKGQVVLGLHTADQIPGTEQTCHDAGYSITPTAD